MKYVRLFIYLRFSSKTAARQSGGARNNRDVAQNLSAVGRTVGRDEHYPPEVVMAGMRDLVAAVLLIGAVVGLASRARAADQVDVQIYKKVGDRELKVRI